MPAKRASSHLDRIARSLGLIFLGTAVSLIRQRGPGALDTLWAEDGSVFLQGALDDNHPRVWLQSYAGYMHLAPRVLATVAANLPVEWVPLVMSGGAALAVSCLAFAVFRFSETRVPGRPERLALAVCMVALPSAGMEAANSAANIHWYLLYALAWVAVCRPEGRRLTVASSLVAFTAAASNPFAALALPFIGWRVARERRGPDVARLGSLTAGVALQAFVVLSAVGSRPLDPTGNSITALTRWYGFHVLEAAAFGLGLRDASVHALGVAASGAIALAVSAYMLTPAVRAAMRNPVLPLVFAILHGAFYFLPVALAQTTTPRYAIAPILLIYATVAWGIWHDREHRQVGRKRAAVALLAVIGLVDFSPRNERSLGPGWRAELSSARQACSMHPLAEAALRIPPRNLPPGDPREMYGYWTVRIPCGELASGGASNTAVTSRGHAVTQAMQPKR
jgi:hypothetical protein